MKRCEYLDFILNYKPTEALSEDYSWIRKINYSLKEQTQLIELVKQLNVNGFNSQDAVNEQCQAAWQGIKSDRNGFASVINALYEQESPNGLNQTTLNEVHNLFTNDLIELIKTKKFDFKTNQFAPIVWGLVINGLNRQTLMLSEYQDIIYEGLQVDLLKKIWELHTWSDSQSWNDVAFLIKQTKNVKLKEQLKNDARLSINISESYSNTYVNWVIYKHKDLFNSFIKNPEAAYHVFIKLLEGKRDIELIDELKFDSHGHITFSEVMKKRNMVLNTAQKPEKIVEQLVEKFEGSKAESFSQIYENLISFIDNNKNRNKKNELINDWISVIEREIELNNKERYGSKRIKWVEGIKIFNHLAYVFDVHNEFSQAIGENKIVQEKITNALINGMPSDDLSAATVADYKMLKDLLDNIGIHVNLAEGLLKKYTDNLPNFSIQKPAFVLWFKVAPEQWLENQDQLNDLWNKVKARTRTDVEKELIDDFEKRLAKFQEKQLKKQINTKLVSAHKNMSL